MKETLDACHALINTKYWNNNKNTMKDNDLSLALYVTAIMSFPRASHLFLYT